MTPAEFQSLALAWIAVSLAVILALIAAFVSIRNAIQSALHGQQLDQNTARLNGQSAKIDTLMLNTSPPGQSTVAVALSSSPQQQPAASEPDADTTNTTAGDTGKEQATTP